jgi:hypothetical protein
VLGIRLLKVGYAKRNADVADTSCDDFIRLRVVVSRFLVACSRSTDQAHERIRVLLLLLGASLLLLLRSSVRLTHSGTVVEVHICENESGVQMGVQVGVWQV